jgi:membrane-bound lytic murein transglycosylase D
VPLGYLGQCLLVSGLATSLSACYTLTEGLEHETDADAGHHAVILGDPHTDLSHLDDSVSVSFLNESKPPAAEDASESDPNDDFGLGDTGTNSIWPRVRKGFQLEPDVDHDLLHVELNWYRKHPKYLNRVMERAEPFLYSILNEAEERGLPSELVLLPIVESAYQPFAYSHGRAAGIWQFIPSTGKLYGLEQNWWYDGRRDIHASTQAALQFLQNLSNLFDGDWMLALAAYNSGSGTVQRAIKRNKKLGRPTDFWHLNLPQETRTYVPKLLALKELIEHTSKYGVSLLCIPDAPGFVQVDTGSQIDMALAAELAEIDIDTLYRYNPAFNRWATAPDGPHKLLIPTDHADIFRANLEALPENERIQWKRHKIHNGETLSQIAAKYSTTVKQLRKTNDLHGNSIRAGKYLIIPVSSKSPSSYALSAVQRLKMTQSRAGASGGKTRIEHVVGNGESFWTISRDYKVNMHKLAKWNGMAIKDPLRKGKKLVVWTRQSPSGKTAGYRKPANSVRPISYTVRSGDSLSRIADRYNVSVNDLHRWNSINGKYLHPGQHLKLYVDVTEQAGESS